MNIVYLIGNGFDINLGMETGYKAFYNQYCTKDNNDYIIQEFKQSIKTNKDLWSDLETELGKYIDNLDKSSELDKIHGDLVDELAEYLQEVQQKFINNTLSRVSAEKLIHNLFHPEDFVMPRDKNALLGYYKQKKMTEHHVHVINFNYTHTMEHILGLDTSLNSYSDLHIQGDNLNTKGKCYLKSIRHVHGTLDMGMVLGVDNEKQVNHIDLSKDPNVRNQLIKPECNLAMRHGIEVECERLINDAHIICIYGSSIGHTDRVWWDLISKNLRERNCRLVVFDYEPSFSSRKAYLLEKYKTEALEKLFSETKLQDMSELVHFALNTDIFSIVDKKVLKTA